MLQRKLESIYNVHTEHVQYDLMDYAANRLNADERRRVEGHLHLCSRCQADYSSLLATVAHVSDKQITGPNSVYYSTILPRVRERINSRQPSSWTESIRITKIVLPLAVFVFIIILLSRVPQESPGEFSQTDALHQVVNDLNTADIVQAIEKEYTGMGLTSNQEVAAAGVSEHLQGDHFLTSAVSKQIENEEIAEIDVDGMISDLNGEQVDQVLSGLSERNRL
jgi:hypothetical protein